MAISLLGAGCGHKDLSEDIAYYKRKGENSDHVDRSLRFLEDSVNRCVRVAREEKNRRALSQALIGEGRPAMPGPSAAREGWWETPNLVRLPPARVLQQGR